MQRVSFFHLPGLQTVTFILHYRITVRIRSQRKERGIARIEGTLLRKSHTGSYVHEGLFRPPTPQKERELSEEYKNQ